jgi:microtubule-associated protein-like 6
MIACVDVKRAARCVAWRHDGAVLAIGFHESVKGGGKKNVSGKAPKKKGDAKGASSKGIEGSSDSPESNAACFVYSFSADSSPMLERIAFGGTSTAWISDIKFNPSGTVLALGSHDKSLYMYDVPDSTVSSHWANVFNSPKFTPFNKHSSAVTHFDFSQDGKYWQSNCQAYELLFGNIDTGKQETSATKLAIYNGSDDPDIRWATWTCTLGWPVQGIWPVGADGSDINAVDRSKSCELIATADDFGLVKLFRYPCITEGAKWSEFSGHSSHVTNVRWSASDNLISTGGNDKCLFIWNLVN